jgi:hypothetical protein
MEQIEDEIEESYLRVCNVLLTDSAPARRGPPANCAAVAFRLIRRVTAAYNRLTDIPHIRTPMMLSNGASVRQPDGRLTSLQPRVESRGSVVSDVRPDCHEVGQRC